MLTNKQIEDQDYSINDVADLKLRLEIAENSLLAIQGALKHDQPHKAYEFAVNDYVRITNGHNHNCDGSVVLNSQGYYSCACYLIASAE